MQLPGMFLTRQIFPRPVVRDIPLRIRRELKRIGFNERIGSGDSIAITVGSRGIANMPLILKSLVAELKSIGAHPFILPAMGSHGGATAEGQKAVLEDYGITERSIGVPIRSSMDVLKVGHLPDGSPVYLDKLAAEADGIVVLNRIKPHTDFVGRIGSGLMKMMAIGLGKKRGAELYHRLFFKHGFEKTIRWAAREVLRRCKVKFGIGIIENAYEETADIVALPPEEIEEGEEKLFAKAKELSGRLPFEDLDVLIVDKMGKDISGTGMDTNVIGRMMQNFEPEPEKPDILRIVVLDLTDRSHGNAVGMGLADFTTARLVSKIDRKATYTNSITSLGPQKSRIPLYLDTDREAIEAAFATVGIREPKECRAVHIRSTLHLHLIEISESLLEEAEEREDLEIISGPEPLRFDEGGNLISRLAMLDVESHGDLRG
ncbi:TPA: DUF2088 domain-containing protein [Candidatus Poribacteria bacterium]|nr:DUF2088 domain-containing protein [Candidatus Poribacteria bacterium]